MRPEELEQEVSRLLDLESRTFERSEKQKLASLAFALAQNAEALSRVQQPEVLSSAFDQMKVVAVSNIEQFSEQRPKRRNFPRS